MVFLMCEIVNPLEADRHVSTTSLGKVVLKGRGCSGLNLLLVLRYCGF